MWDDKWTGKTIGAALDEAAERYGDKVATVFQNSEVTYSQLKQKADLVARGFRCAHRGRERGLERRLAAAEPQVGERRRALG